MGILGAFLLVASAIGEAVFRILAFIFEDNTVFFVLYVIFFVAFLGLMSYNLVSVIL